VICAGESTKSFPLPQAEIYGEGGLEKAKFILSLQSRESLRIINISLELVQGAQRVMSDDVTRWLPTQYDSLAGLQREFEQYQIRAFPVRGANFFALELNGEAGELANLEKKAWKNLEVSPERFADEAADVFIALLNYANARKIDLAEAVRKKMAVIDQKRRDGSHG